jgi:hypothetical protein
MSEFSNSGHNPNPYQRNTHLNNDDSTSNSTISRFSEGLSIRTSVVANDEGSYEGSVLGFDSDGEVSTANTQSSTSTVNHSTTAKPRPVFDSEGRRISIHQFTYPFPFDVSETRLQEISSSFIELSGHLFGLHVHPPDDPEEVVDLIQHPPPPVPSYPFSRSNYAEVYDTDIERLEEGKWLRLVLSIDLGRRIFTPYSNRESVRRT